MRPSFSEFTFGYALVSELSSGISPALRSVPIFPSLREEADGGYDVQMDNPGVPLFLQFKLPEYLTKRSAREISKHKVYRKPGFYRINIYGSNISTQHAELLKLERNNSADVFYVFPLFHTSYDLNSKYRTYSISDSCYFIRPSEIGAFNDNESHSVSYHPEEKGVFIFSEPRPIDARIGVDSLTRFILSELEDETPVSEKISELLGNFVMFSFDPGTPREDIQNTFLYTVAEYYQINFGLTMILVQRED